MKDTFYDVKERKSVEADVAEKVVYGKAGSERYAFKAKTADGRTADEIRQQGQMGRSESVAHSR